MKKKITIDSKQKSDFKEIMDVLNEEHECIYIRPCGFGKTYALSEFTKYYDIIVYMYPLDIIRKQSLQKYADKWKKVEYHFITYQQISRWYSSENLFKNFDNIVESDKKILFIQDEAHLIGGNKISKAMLLLKERYQDRVDFLGATATPDRNDKFNVVATFYKFHTISDYTLAQAIKDGLYKRPKYIRATYKEKEIINDVVSKLKLTDTTKEKVKNSLTQLTRMQQLNLKTDSIPDIYRRNIDKKDYMRFIIFFPYIKDLMIRRKEVIKEFKDAFPDYEVEDIILISDKEYKKNIEVVENLPIEDHKILFILCRDMLNMGYHVDNITGIVMWRGTGSDAVYNQQVGRCMSVMSKEVAIIFDFIGNWERKQYSSFFDDNSRYTTGTNEVNRLTRECMDVQDDTLELEKNLRLWKKASRYNIELHVDAYVNKACPLDYVLHALHINFEEFKYLMNSLGEPIREDDLKENGY